MLKLTLLSLLSFSAFAEEIRVGSQADLEYLQKNTKHTRGEPISRGPASIESDKKEFKELSGEMKRLEMKAKIPTAPKY